MINLSNKTKIIITLIWVAILLVSGIVPMFPIISYNGQDIRLFAPSRIGTSFIFAKGFIRPTERFYGKVRHTEILETKYGQITLKKSARIEVADNTIFRIPVDVFEKELATHDLIVEGIEIPKKITVRFMDGKLSGFALGGQEAVVSGILFYITRNIDIYSDYERSKDDISVAMRGRIIQDDITLADSTRLDVSKFFGPLYIEGDKGRWILNCSPTSYFAAMRPGETEYTRYSSITFEKDWGAFISGELFEEQQ